MECDSKNRPKVNNNGAVPDSRVFRWYALARVSVVRGEGEGRERERERERESKKKSFDLGGSVQFKRRDAREREEKKYQAEKNFFRLSFIDR